MGDYDELSCNEYDDDYEEEDDNLAELPERIDQRKTCCSGRHSRESGRYSQTYFSRANATERVPCEAMIVPTVGTRVAASKPRSSSRKQVSRATGTRKEIQLPEPEPNESEVKHLPGSIIQKLKEAGALPEDDADVSQHDRGHQTEVMSKRFPMAQFEGKTSITQSRVGSDGGQASNVIVPAYVRANMADKPATMQRFSDVDEFPQESIMSRYERPSTESWEGRSCRRTSCECDCDGRPSDSVRSSRREQPGRFDGNTSYRSSFSGDDGRPSKTIVPKYERPKYAKFEGTTSYRSSFVGTDGRPSESIYPSQRRIQSGKFEDSTSYRASYAGTDGLPSVSCRPRHTPTRIYHCQEHDSSMWRTTYNSDFTHDALQTRRGGATGDTLVAARPHNR